MGVRQQPLSLRGAGGLLPPATMWDRDQGCLRTIPARTAKGELEWLRTHSPPTLTLNLCNTIIVAATGCSFYDKAPFVELSGREAGCYLAKMALREILQ